MTSRSKADNTQRAAASFSNHDFDFGLGPEFARSSASGSLNAQKQQNSTSQSGAGAPGGAPWAQQRSTAKSSSPSWTGSSSTHTPPVSSSSSSAGAWAWQNPSASSGLHAPARSMVGDITGKSWGAMDNIPKSSADRSGLVGGLNKGASLDLFGDLLGSSRSYSSPNNSKQHPQARQENKVSTFSNLESMGAALPKGTPMKAMKVSKAHQTEEMGDFVSADNAQKANNTDAGWAAFEALSSSRSSLGSSEFGKVPQKHPQMPSSEDPFGDFQSIPSAKAASSASAGTTNSFYGAEAPSSLSDDLFNVATSAPSNGPAPKSNDNSRSSNDNNVDPFAFLGNSKMPASQPSNMNNVESDPFESFLGKMSSQPKQTAPDLDSLWGSSKPQPSFSAQDVSDSWGVETNFGAGDTNTTTELDGLPPLPPGVSFALLKEKGLEYYKQGQFADAIKWLSWAETLLHQTGESGQIVEVLTCRSSCLKEAGEYKKAVADCTKVIEHDKGNTSILLQRALLYESMEKYKLGMADLKEVLKKDPQNRLAISTLARLKKMAD